MLPLVVISDGLGYYDKVTVAAGAKYIHGRHLKRREHGAAWIKRQYGVGLLLDCSWVVKIDPDARLHRPFLIPFPNVDWFGTIAWGIGHPNECVQGGCKVFSRSFLQRGLRECDERFLDPNFWAVTPFQKDWLASLPPSYIACDLCDQMVARLIGATVADYPDICSIPQPWQLRRILETNQDFAVTHPHK
jgi:hypothetical protein